MQIFLMSANQMLILALFVVVGYLLVRFKIAPENTGTVLSKLEAFLLVPCLQFVTFWKYCTVENFKAQWQLILFGAVAAVFYGVTAVLVGRLVSKDPYERKLLYYGFTTTNGFISDAVVLGLFGEEALFYFLMFTLPLAIYTYAIGVPGMMPGGNTFGSRMKKLLNPCLLSELIGLVCGLLSLQLPDFLSGAISTASSCMSPVAMILTGAVIATFKMKDLFNMPRTWISTVYRLLVIPAVTVLVLKLLYVNDLTMTLAVCLAAMPVGLNTVIFPTAYGRDTRFGASLVLLSSLFSLLTIPVFFLLFVKGI